jgi:hypothetical protein
MSEKFTVCRCISCRGGIEFETANFQPGMVIDCPHCQKPTGLYLSDEPRPLPPPLLPVKPPIISQTPPPIITRPHYPPAVFCAVCHSVGQPVVRKRGSAGVEVALYLAAVIPGILHSIWRSSTKAWACGVCGSPMVVPVNSPLAQAHLKKES